MKKDIRIIALDLDGTLLDSDKKLSERNYQALKTAAEKGIEIDAMSSPPFYSSLGSISLTASMTVTWMTVLISRDRCGKGSKNSH